MKKYYLVVEQGYEYDDEHYNEVYGYTIDSKLLSSKEEAEKIANEKNDKSEKQEWFQDDDGNSIRPFKVIEITE